ncbi:MAG: VacB/RNase II family 3'-5' exoribonuclease [Clostridia bacterium]|nr:VacB/RNase II family 3'-5' exoribonuclease [Clostridia bacterium]
MKRKRGKKEKYGNRGAKKRIARSSVRSLASDRRKPKAQTKRREDAPIVHGVFDYSGDGYGFCRVEDGSRADVFIPPDATAGAMTGDTVSVAIRRSEGTRTEGEVVSFDERANGSVVGTVVPVGARFYVKPKNAKLRVTFRAEGGIPFEAGDLVLAVPVGKGYFERSSRRADEYDPLTLKREAPLPCVVTKNYGAAEEMHANYDAVLDSSGIPTVFSREAEAEAEEAAREAVVPDGRVDLRDELIFTLDGAGAKDLDDAVSLKRTDGGFELGVHIADVSHYVKEGGALDRDARDRGTSVYFTDKVVPMLPAVLSNGCCSLSGGEERYTLSVAVTLNEKGERVKASLFPSVIRSSLRGVYSEANDVLESGKKSPFYEKYSAVADTLSLMWELACLLKKKRTASGAVELAEDEAAIMLGEDGSPVDVVRIERGKTERIIEQFMLEANIAAASIGTDRGLPFVYRVHEEPSAEKLSDLAGALAVIGVDPHGVDKVPARASYGPISEILKDAEAMGQGVFDTVSGIVLRSMMKAKYSPVPGRHFGIGADLYCHFTSPIRRYPDLFIHRELSAAAYAAGGALDTGASSDGAGAKRTKESTDAAAVSTDREMRAVAAERQIEALFIAEYMRGKTGEEFDAAVSSATPFGLFVRLSNTAEGLVPMTEFPEGAEAAKNGAQIVAGEQRYRLGDTVRVRLTGADVTTGKLTFALVR